MLSPRSSLRFRLAKAIMAIAAVMVLAVPLLEPYAAEAQNSPEANKALVPGAGFPVAITGNPYQEVRNQINGFFDTLTIGGITGLMNAFTVFNQRIAYDVAQRILTGDAGQYPMFWEDGYGAYIGKVALSAGDQFVSAINSDVFNTLGFDLCRPIDPLRLQLSLKLPSPTTLQAKCTLAQIGAAFEQTKQAFNNSAEVFANIAPQFDPRANQLAVGIAVHQSYLDAVAKATLGAQLDRQETQGLKNVQDKITGFIKTPSEVLRNELREATLIGTQTEGQRLQYQALMGNAFKLGFTQLGMLTASTFVSTLANGLLQKLFTGLKGSGLGSLANVDVLQSDIANNHNVAEARIVFSDLLTPNLISNDQQDFVTELSTCPEPRGLWGCSMDDAFVAGLRTVGENGAYTVGRAAQVVLSDQVPGNPAFLHKEWELIPSVDTKEDRDPSCYQRAYCATNLAKLRYARILPVGWELAANSPYNTKHNGKYITLEEVIRGFRNCNDQGKTDASHPWCKLVDPDWALSAPPFKCRVKGFGDTVFPGTGVRLEECADAVSCLGRDDRGKCTAGYGYCLAEKPVWRFSGDVCLERFASCRTYMGRDNRQVSYLRNTIDYGSCTADNVGCLWYATLRNPGVTTQDGWVGNAAGTVGSRIYLDASVKTCDASNDGCTRLLQIKPGLSALNLIPNSSFENSVSGDESKLQYWTVPSGYQTPTTQDSSPSVHGSRSLQPVLTPGGEVKSDFVRIVPLRNYTVSMFARTLDSTAVGELDVQLSLKDANSQPVVGSNYYRSTGCSVASADVVGFKETLSIGSVSTGWKRFECSFLSATSTASGMITVKGNNILVDAIQLEESEKATVYVDGVSADLQETTVKIAPDEFACTGSKNDHPLCSKYARTCQQTDQGCQGYRDTVDATAPEIPASLTASDACPATCVGYAEYRKQPSAFDLGKNIDQRLNDPEDDTSAAFVPNAPYAQQCTLADVGCEEFTDVGSTSTGAEQKGYYNYLRACEKPSERSQTFFTWEGSDTTGYQLRTWSLVNDPTQSPAAPTLVQKTGPDSVLKDPASCNAFSWKTGADADCRQFFDAEGRVFYAYFSQTVVSTPNCRDLRKSQSNSADCQKTGGSFSATTNECLYRALPSESRMCSQVNAGCRAYIGTTGRNTSVVFSEDFRNGSTTAAFTTGTLSHESVLVGDQSLKVASPETETATIFPALPNTLYRVSFWAKTVTPGQSATVSVDGVVIGTAQMQADWARYEFGPFAARAASSSAVTSTIAWVGVPNPTFIDQIRIERLRDVSYLVKNSWTVPQECDQTPEGTPQPQAMLGCRAYTDRNGKAVTARSFNSLCREEVIGCTGYVDTRNSQDPYGQTFALTGTSKNPKVDGLGNPIQPDYDFEKKFVGDATTTRAADRFIYLIDEPRAHCDASMASCRAFGRPKYAQDQLALTSSSSTGAFETVYFLDDITRYVNQNGEPGTLCRKDELFCEEFKSGNTVAYFRTPQDHMCEWRDKVQLKKNPAQGITADGVYSGWFRTGSNVPCYPQKLSTGGTYLLNNSGDQGYTGWVGACPVEQSECSEFRDPNDHSDPAHPSGKPYFFIKNSHLDLSSCSGKIDLLSGCVLFRDMSESDLVFNTTATYAKSAAEQDSPGAPVNCQSDPSNPFCKNVGKCQNVRLDSACVLTDVGTPTEHYFCPMLSASYSIGDIKGAITKMQGATCTTNDDCTAPGLSGSPVKGQCLVNDSNAVLKVKLDRDCAKWLGCSSAETVFDPAQQKYVDLCTEVAMCDQSKGADAGSFCAHYVDRSKEPILKQGVFFDQGVYTSRSVGFGQEDYSGYVIPDHFQSADIENRRVGYELFDKIPELKNTFAADYRLVAAVPESTGLVIVPTSSNAIVDNLYPALRICTYRATGRTGYFMPGAVGKRTCYFAIDALTQRSVDFQNTAYTGTKADPRDIQPLSDILRQSKDPKNDKALNQALPPAECLAHPESDAPFPNTYVQEWDTTVQPANAKVRAPGYESVNLCGNGEACDCSYRKVKYGGQVTKYYAPFGQAPLGGICSGGTNDGRACVPGTAATTGQGASVQTIVQQAATNGDPGCPGGGRCLDISDVALVRGQFGQCLQRDYSRTLANDPGRYPCLVWNPNPILAGSGDVYHYQPTAGYMPPVNSGEYYCLSYANAPIQTIWSAQSHSDWQDSRRTAEDGLNQFFVLPGQLSKFNYDRGYIAGQCPQSADICGNFLEGNCNCHDGVNSGSMEDENGVPTVRDYKEVYGAAAIGSQAARELIESRLPPIVKDYTTCSVDSNPMAAGCGDIWRFQNLGLGIDGNAPDANGEQGPQALSCALAAGNVPGGGSGSDSWPGHGGTAPGIGPADKAPDVDYNRGRWIQTGRGIANTYMEYFVPVKASGVASWLSGGAPPEQFKRPSLLQSTMEKNFSQFQFFASNDQFLSACSIPPWYVDGVTMNLEDYTDMNKVAQASNQIYSTFNQNFNGALDRSKEQIVKDAAGHPIKEACSGLNDGKDDGDLGGDAEGRCYLKVWETNYRMDGSPKFEWLDNVRGVSFWNRHTQYYAHERTCSQSGFAIRAVFENTDRQQNSIPENQVSESQLNGPYRFVGFWITACTVGTDQESFLYLNLRVKHADTCTELAQVVAPYSRENAAFTDRIWRNGSFVVPILGFNYGTGYAPFGSALANGIPGVSPLFQEHGAIQDYSPLRPPTFLGSGQEYFSGRTSPLDKWAYLTNIFARVYRVYRYYDAGVGMDGYACTTDSANPGATCPKPVNGQDAVWLASVKKVCGGVGTCNADSVPKTVKNMVSRCNGLSGVNAGLTCGSGVAKASLDPVCHNAAMKQMPNGGLEPQLSECKMRSGWHSKIDPTSGITWYCNAADGNCLQKQDLLKNPSGQLNAKSAHEMYNAFGCDSNSVVPNAGCSEPTQKSFDCPKKITNVTCVADDFGPMGGHCDSGYEHARCKPSKNTASGNPDCVFTASQWWGAYDKGQTVLPAEDTDEYAKSGLMPSLYNSDNPQEPLGVLAKKLAHASAMYYPTNAPTPGDILFPKMTGAYSAFLPLPNYGANVANVVADSMGNIPRVSGRLRLPSPNPVLTKVPILCDGFSMYATTSNCGASTIVGPLGPHRTQPFAFQLRWGAYTPRISTALSERWPAPHSVHNIPELKLTQQMVDFLNDPKNLPCIQTEVCTDEQIEIANQILKKLEVITFEEAYPQDNAVIAGLCEGAEGAAQDPGSTAGDGGKVEGANAADYVYGQYQNTGIEFGYGSGPLNEYIHTLGKKNGKSLSTVGRKTYVLIAGQCDGGSRQNEFCYNDSNVSASTWGDHSNTCVSTKAGSTNYATLCKPVATLQPDGVWQPTEEATMNCTSQTGDPLSNDPNLDKNSCTRGAGYYPRKDLCGNDLNNEKCLTGYDLTINKQQSLDQTKSLAPTDVTMGFHSPQYLGLTGGNSYDYQHIAFYAPRPPMVAAPDLSRSCQTPGSCPISTVNAISIEGQSSGPITYAGGQGQATMRFYGWAAHDQAPLRGVYVDWGDGSVVKIEDASVKNKKPFCATTNECTLVPGLTCNTDADCPPGGGKCAAKGACSQSPSQSCFSDAECKATSGRQDAKCVIRQFFGNSDEACEANYFEFTHAFSCDKNVLPSCNTKGNPGGAADRRCSRNNNIVCTADSDCCGANGQGCTAEDKCMAGLAPSSDGSGGGCYDAVKNACVFTPKVLLKDSWNWCTGECRAGQQVGGSLLDTDPSSLNASKVRHVYGGCWDGTETKKNTNLNSPIMNSNGASNECSVSPSDSAGSPQFRPWIIYQGSVEVGVVQ